jgi:hypothetical protein
MSAMTVGNDSYGTRRVSQKGRLDGSNRLQSGARRCKPLQTVAGAGFDTFLMRIPRKKRPEDAQVAQRLSGLDPKRPKLPQEPLVRNLLPDSHR